MRDIEHVGYNIGCVEVDCFVKEIGLCRTNVNLSG